jgi:hypothetical protein
LGSDKNGNSISENNLNKILLDLHYMCVYTLLEEGIRQHSNVRFPSDSFPILLHKLKSNAYRIRNV